MEKTKLPAEVIEGIRHTHLAYLFRETEAYLLPLTSDRKFDLHEGCILKLDAVTLKAGTMVWAFKHPRIYYSAYKRVFDEDYPAKGADVLTTGADWTLFAFVDGKPADAYVTTEKHEPKIIGRVE